MPCPTEQVMYNMKQKYTHYCVQLYVQLLNLVTLVSNWRVEKCGKVFLDEVQGAVDASQGA